MHRSRLLLTLLLACATANAQQAPPAYDSAFGDYKKYAEPQVADWKQTNAAIAAKAGPDPHAGHDMGKTEARTDAHAAHNSAKAKPMAVPIVKPAKPDPHAGHQH